MKKLIFTSVLFLWLTGGSNAANWLTSFEDAQKIALATDKLMLVDFWATWCGPCQKMDSESWAKKDVGELMEGYIPVKVDIDIRSDLASKYEVKGIPFIFIMDGNGTVIHKEIGYKPKSDIVSLLKKYAINTSYLKISLAHFYANKTFLNSFRLASKYSDFSVLLDKTIRNDFLNASNEYFSISEKLLKKEDIKNKDWYSQKIELYSIQRILILDNSKRASKLLDKIKEENLDAFNKSHYCFLNYICCSKNGDTDQAEIWKSKLNESELAKANTFLK